MKTLGLVLAASLSLAMAARGQESPDAAEDETPISTDRPGLLFSTSTVPVGTFQIELGVPAFTFNSAAGVETRAYNFPTLLRVGVVERLELRAGSTLYNNLRTELDEDGGIEDTTEDGFGDLELGLKWSPVSNAGAVPAIALIPSVILPTGEAPFTTDRAAYALNAVASWSLPSGLGVTLLGGVAVRPVGEDDHDTFGALGGLLGRALATNLSGYVEVGYFPTPNSEDPAFAGAGLAYLVAPRLQLDAFFDRGLNDASADWQLGAGVSTKL